MPSSAISAFFYDDDRAVLRVVFVTGMVYDYKDVPPKVYAAMKASGSKGTYLNKKIKGHYTFEKVK